MTRLAGEERREIGEGERRRERAGLVEERGGTKKKETWAVVF